jgi:uncharacterized protein (TIGR00369 family)
MLGAHGHPMETRNREDRLKELLDLFVDEFPFNRELGLEIVSAQAGVAVTRLLYREDLVGNPDTGILHGGLVTMLLDATGAIAVFCRMPEPDFVATLDLRIDYLRPAPAGEPVYARVECYRLTRAVAFTRGVAYYGDAEDPVASMSATYML